ncbi:hypothetical protein GGR52DRAFT_350487 [Hypoxylon sp. FL1284]|nr:hypothetical protein GGR52DRAFT_350487 [Hypoxylon sp. FL1284]
MASATPVRKPKSGGKFRSIFSDMKKFKIHRREKRKFEGEGVIESVMADPAPVPVLPQAPEMKATSRTVSAPNSLYVGNLAVQVTVTFDEPLNYSYSRNYEASPSLQATETLCQGLLRRIDHCCYEMITRKDATAMEYAAASGPDKPLRFEIQIDIIRGWSEIWASRTFKSYQRQPLSPEAASQVILSTHYIVGLFLRRHDDGFVWKSGPVRDDPSQEVGKFPHRAGRVQPMSCVPRFYFLERPQSFESIPGFSINFSFTSRCQRRHPPEWHTSVEVNSHQTAPLNSIGAETLFFEASYALEGAFRAERHAFEAVHNVCASIDGCKNCRHHDNDGLELRVSVANNLGPQFPNLERTIHCNSNLSFHSDVQNCVRFVKRVESSLSRTRNDADDMISRMNDIEFRITELRGRGWTLDEPLIFILGPYKSFSQRTVTALLDRIQAGVADVLRSNAISVRMTAHKRGHFILDKTLVAREPFEATGTPKTKAARKSKPYVIDRLRQRIERDIQLVCKDTLTVDDIEEEIRLSEREACVKSPVSRDAEADADVVTSSSSEFAVSESISNGTTGPHDDSTYPSTNPETSFAASASKSSINDEDPACQTSDSAAPGTEELTTSSDARPGPARRSSEPIRCSNTGARAFPLVPGLNDFTDPDSSRTSDGSSTTNLHRSVSDIPAVPSLPAKSSRPSTPNKAGGSEKKKSDSTTNLGEASGSAAIYDPSIASSTPSLMFGGGSPSSSFLITPKTHRFDAETDYPKNAIVDSDDDSRDSESINYEARQDVAKVPSPKLRHVTKPISFSPLRVTQMAPEQSSVISIPESGGAPLRDTPETSNVKVEPEQPSAASETLGETSASATKAEPDTPAPAQSEAERDSSPESKEDVSIPSIEVEVDTELPAPDVEPPAAATTACNESSDSLGDHFSQSKHDFVFSSPQAVTPEGSVAGENYSAAATAAATSSASPDPEPSDEVDADVSSNDPLDTDIFSEEASPRRPERSSRKSFGSAGMLGFHEQMFGSVSLRSTLTRSRSRPRVPSGAIYDIAVDAMPEPVRPGTAM